jgi:hypothetical protein
LAIVVQKLDGRLVASFSESDCKSSREQQVSGELAKRLIAPLFARSNALESDIEEEDFCCGLALSRIKSRRASCWKAVWSDLGWTKYDAFGSRSLRQGAARSWS